MSISPTLQKSGRGVNGSAYLVEGMSSAADPMFISDRAYRTGVNVTHRGGVPKTRPGYRQIFDLPGGRIQGMSYFRPLGGPQFLVFAIAGTIYKSQFPFTSYSAIGGISLYQYAKNVYFSVTTRTVRPLEDGSLELIDPIRILVMQDGGYTAPVWFDGNSSGRLDPGASQTPVGGPIKFSGDRLWVARGNQLFASDISDPFTFTEVSYAAEGGSFIFPEAIVALEEVPSLENPQLVVFCENSTHLIQSNLRDRTTWKETKNFQQQLFPGVGCTSHRSVVAHHGLLWWMTQAGLTNFNSAAQARVSSRLVPQDSEMAVSKYNLSSDLSTVAAGVIENFLFMSVPYGSKYNTHTWVLDNAVVSENQGDSSHSWAGYWTGTQPVEWASGVFAGRHRIYFISKDSDGQNRLWEAMTETRADNDTPIESFIETKTHIDFSEKATGLDLKRIVFAEVHFVDILGEVEVEIFWAGVRGKYKKVGQWTLNAKPGSLYADEPVGDPFTHRPQSRVIRTPSISAAPDDCTSCNVESTRTDNFDVGFSLLIVWRGQAGVRSYRIFADPEQESAEGRKEFNETEGTVLSGVTCPELSQE